MRKTIIFYAVVLACLLPALLLRDYTPSSELRYLSIADEALRNHEFFAFTDHGEAYIDKPPLFLWLVMIGRLLPVWLQHLYLGLLSVIPAFVITELMAKTLSLKGNRLLVFRLILLTAALFLVSMLTIRMDMLLTMFIMLSVIEFYRLYNSSNPHESWRLPLLLFLGTFTKGPVGFIIPLGIILLFLFVKGRETDFFKYLGWKSWLLFFALLGGWMLGVYLEGGSDYLNALVTHQTLDGTIHSSHHREPIYYYLYMVWLLLLPWSLWAILSAFRAWTSETTRGYEARIMAIVCLAAFVIISLLSSKLSIYLLPFVPLVMSATVLDNDKGNDRWVVLSLAIPYALLVLALPVMGWFYSREPIMREINTPLLWVGTTCVSLAAAWALWLVIHKRVYKSVCIMAVGLLLETFLAGLSWPKMNSYIGYRQVCVEAVNASRQYNTNTYVAVDLKHSRNMDVYLGKSPLSVEKDSLNAIPHHAIVMTKAKDVASLQLEDVRMVGDKAVGYKR
ncbi:MAG: ArnT family glycosyltransferase [Prevotella sp.]